MNVELGQMKTQKTKGCFLIAEIGGNHGGSVEYAKKLTKLAAESGADAVKFQTYVANTLVNPTLSKDRHEHFEKLSLTISEFIELAEYCRELNVEFMSSIWDESSIEKLDPYISRHKVGSGDLTNYQLISKLVSTRKPLILSTAMATIEDITQTIRYIDSIDSSFISQGNVTLLHCVAMYGKPDKEYANLGFIKVLQSCFPKIQIGYSDHVAGINATLVAITLGAKCVEVHFTDDKEQDFRDHHLSVLPTELSFIREFSDDIEHLFLDENPEVVSEIETRERIQEFRRAIFPNKNLKAGTTIREEDLVLLRPNIGLDARYLADIVGKRLICDKNIYEILSPSDFEIKD